MTEHTIRTSADDLYEFVKSKGRVTIDDAAKALGLPAEAVHSLVDFLVEEKIFGIEYRFTTPYIYMSKEKDATGKSKSGMSFISKDDFFQRAEERKIPMDEIQHMWMSYLDENLPKIQEEFFERCMKRNIPRSKIDLLWERYLGYLK